MKSSLQMLMKQLPDGADAAMITSNLNRRYFTGLKSSAGILLVTHDAVRLIIDFRYIEKARSVINDFDVILQSDNYYKQIIDFFNEQRVKNILVETDSLTMEQYNRYCDNLKEFTILNDNKLSNFIKKLRSVKSSEEIDCIEKAQTITDRTFTHILNFIRPGITEREIAVEMDYTMKKLGAAELAFDTIVVSGVNSSLPHGVPSDKQIVEGDFVTMDFGACYDGYCSDMTRTVAVGKITEEQKRVYNTVLNAQKMAIESISSCEFYSDVDKIARNFIYEQGYEGCFGHALGHSLGLFIHEDPRFSYFYKEPIQNNVILTVEPGIYLNGKFGVRIENMILITEDRVRNLTQSENKLITL